MTIRPMTRDPILDAAAKHPDPRPSPGDDLVTILIPARDEEATIGACLESVLAQSERNLQVIVVDNGSRDATVEIVESYRARDPRIEIVRHERPSIPGALNAGLAAARGPWMVRVDAHSTIGPNYVRLAVDRLRAGSYAGIGGRKDGIGLTPAGRAIAVALGSRFGVGNSLYHYGTRAQPVDHVPFGAYDTRVLRELGGWNEALEANEDFELDFRLRRAGYRLLFDPALRIDWYCRQRIVDLFRQYRRYGRGKASVAMLHPRSLQARHLAPPALIALFVSAAAVAPFRPLLAGLLVAPYAAGLLVASVLDSRRVEGFGARLRLPPAFLAMHVGWGVGLWEGLVRGLFRRRRTSPSAR